MIWSRRSPASTKRFLVPDQIGQAVKRWYKKNGIGAMPVEWTAPKFEEVALNCEINSYASAEL
ncbi:MAG: pyrroloquinoline quinone precursor peptide PqqA [Acidobacteria bacterium]|nr:MAG: pyrroloquinoline quinone precursor peptide PqqA [Acidobacteriota bacterium]PYX12919.1 MAG: pyrroloquinoline quinone precursor peptide PqqA [Acidobacteriota bacterium]